MGRRQKAHREGQPKGPGPRWGGWWPSRQCLHPKVKELEHESSREMIQPLHKMEVSPGIRGQKPHSAWGWRFTPPWQGLGRGRWQQVGSVRGFWVLRAWLGTCELWRPPPHDSEGPATRIKPAEDRKAVTRCAKNRVSEGWSPVKKHPNSFALGSPQKQRTGALPGRNLSSDGEGRSGFGQHLRLPYDAGSRDRRKIGEEGVLGQKLQLS